MAPKAEVKMKIMEAAAAPYDEAFALSPALCASLQRYEKAPPRNMAIPWAMEPQYSVHRRPIRSNVKTQTRVANCWFNQMRLNEEETVGDKHTM